MAIWEMRDLWEADEFLGMTIQRNRPLRQISIDQTAYLNKVINRFNMQNAKPASTPLPMGYTPHISLEKASPELLHRYQSVIGSLMYLMLGTRPDINYAVIKLSMYMANPNQSHLDKALYILRYLNGTSKYHLQYDGTTENNGLITFCDSDYGSDPDTRKLQSGMLVKLAGAAICWKSRKQDTVALSSTEAEYVSLSDSIRQLIWIRSLLGEIGFEIPTVPLCGDNQGSLFMAQNPITESRSKHIDIKFHFIRQKIQKIIQLYYEPTETNVADMLTKNLSPDKYRNCRDKLGLHFAEK